MNVPRIVIVFTGGTIAMLPDPETGAARPALDGAALLERMSGLGRLADLEPVDRGRVPASHVGFTGMLELAGVLRAAAARDDVDGIVVVQGTDSMEETALAFDLLVPGATPVVVTGAMRTAADPAWDGPRNLRDAVTVAANPAARDRGTMVVMAGVALSADRVIKRHAQSDDAFAACDGGPLGTVEEGTVRWSGDARPRRWLPHIPDAVPEPVHLVTAVAGMDGGLVHALRSTDPVGFVVAGQGAGNTSPELLDACRELMAEGVPVALTTRCPGGRATGAYGFRGGGLTWIDAGAMPCGHLSGPKARIALGLGLGAGLAGPELAAFLEEPA